MSTTIKPTKEADFVSLLKDNCPSTIDLSSAWLIFYNVYSIDTLVKMSNNGDSSFSRAAFFTYWQTNKAFNPQVFASHIQTGKAHVNTLVLLNTNVVPVKVAMIGDMNTHKMVAEFYLDFSNNVYAIAYRQPPKPRKVTIPATTLAKLLPIAAYAAKKNTDCGDLFYHTKDKTIWIVGDDGLKSKHANKLEDMARSAGLDIMIEAEHEPDTKGWILVKPDGTMKTHTVD